MEKVVLIIQGKRIVSKNSLVIKNKKLLFDEIDRKIIRAFYKKPSWWSKPMLVERYEMVKACSKFRKELLMIDKLILKICGLLK